MNHSFRNDQLKQKLIALKTRKYNYDILPPLDSYKDNGVDHINLNDFSDNDNELCKLLGFDNSSSFYHNTYGKFDTIKGFYKYVSTLEKDDRLRYLKGKPLSFLAKKLTPIKIDNLFELMVDALYQRIVQKSGIDLIKANTLPYDIYYTNDTGIRIRPSYANWYLKIVNKVVSFIKEDRLVVPATITINGVGSFIMDKIARTKAVKNDIHNYFNSYKTWLFKPANRIGLYLSKSIIAYVNKGKNSLLELNRYNVSGLKEINDLMARVDASIDYGAYRLNSKDEHGVPWIKQFDQAIKAIEVPPELTNVVSTLLADLNDCFLAIASNNRIHYLLRSIDMKEYSHLNSINEIYVYLVDKIVNDESMYPDLRYLLPSVYELSNNDLNTFMYRTTTKTIPRVMNTLNEMVDNFDIKDTKVFTRDKNEFISTMSDIDIVDTVNDLMDTVQLDNNTKKDIRAKLQTCLLAAKIYAKYYLHLLSTGVEGIDDININDTKDLDKYLEYIKADFYNYVKSDNFNS